MIDLKVRTINYDVHTRAKRRAALSSISRQLKMIREAEIKCLSDDPEDPSRPDFRLLGENAVEAMDWAIDCLSYAYKKEICSIEWKRAEYDPIPF